MYRWYLSQINTQRGHLGTSFACSAFYARVSEGCFNVHLTWHLLLLRESSLQSFTRCFQQGMVFKGMESRGKGLQVSLRVGQGRRNHTLAREVLFLLKIRH